MLRRSDSPARLLRPRILHSRGSLLPGEDGGATVETAVSFILTLTFLFSVMGVGLALYTYHFISEAAREATRYAMVRGSTSTTAQCPTTSGCPATQANIQTYIEDLGFPGINPANMTVTASWPNGNGPGFPVAVTVKYKFPLSVPWVPKATITMTSTSQMIISQ